MPRLLLAAIAIAVFVPHAAARGHQIIGGAPAPSGKYPFIVAVIGNGQGSVWASQYCAGTLIAPKRVLTSALCAEQAEDPTEISVVAGDDDLIGSGKVIGVDGAVVYPGYDAPSQFGDGDIAILRLHRAVTGIAPATLAASLPAAGTDVQIAGWGRTNPDGAFPSHLQEATVKVMADAACRDAFQTGFDAGSMFCAGAPGGGVVPCNGDEGGPLLVDVAGTFQVAGVTSSTLGCSLDVPGLFARVTEPALRGWVLSDPPLPPSEDEPPSITGRPLVGQRLLCHHGSWSSTRPLTYADTWFRTWDGTEVATGNSYTPREADRGVGLACFVSVTDSSGNVTGDAAVTDQIANGRSELPDASAPRARTPRITCAAGRCTIQSRAVDRGGSGLARVEFQIATIAATGTVSMVERDAHVRHGRARLRLALPPGSHVVFARAVDRAGNRQRTPARADYGTGSRTVQVIGGTLTTTTDFPFVGALVYTGVPADVGLHCGGTLIAPTVVLTAAHCVAYTTPGLFDMIFGRSLLSGSGGERIAVTGVSWDPKYDLFGLGNDVALVHLAHAPSGIAPAQLIGPGTASLAAAGAPATIVGWGAILSSQAGEIYPDQLRRGDVVMQSDAVCDRDVGGLFERATMTCAAAGATGQTTCHGDSGGPLLLDDSGTWVVAGITSFGLACGSTTSPGVFTRVLGVRSWLDSSPPPAPVQWGGVFITGRVRVGSTVHCAARVAGSSLVKRYQWFTETRAVHSGRSDAWRLPGALAGHDLFCEATVSNPGGTLETNSSAVRRVIATGHGDGGAPRLQPIRISCSGVLGAGAPDCTADVRASDRGSGVAAVTLTIDAVTPSGNHVVRSWETRRSRASATLPRLAHGTYHILASAVDRAGNRSAPQYVTRTF